VFLIGRRSLLRSPESVRAGLAPDAEGTSRRHRRDRCGATVRRKCRGFWHDWVMRPAAIFFAALVVIAPVLLTVAGQSTNDTDTSTSPSTHLLQVLKHALDSDQLLQENFVSDENLQMLFDATSVEWFLKDDTPPHVGRIAIIRSAFVPKGDIRVSSLSVTGASPQVRSVSIAIKGVPLTQDEVISVFGTPVPWTRRIDPHGDRIPLPLHFGNVDEVVQRPWGGAPKKGASFSIARDGTVDGFMILAIGVTS
jgi:hypothetical protein